MRPRDTALRFESQQALLLGPAHHRLHHPIQIEAARLLSRRELTEALEPATDVSPRRRDHEHVLEVPALVADRVFFFGALERIHSQVGDHRSAQLRERLLPDLEALAFLLEEGDLPVLVPQRGDAAVVGPVNELLARPGTLATQRGAKRPNTGDEWESGLGYTYPRRVMELLDPLSNSVGFA